MASNIITTLKSLKPNTSTSKTEPTKPPCKLAAHRPKPLELAPSMSTHNAAVKTHLPCGCSRAHVLIQRLDTILESPKTSFPGTTAEFSSVSSSIASPSQTSPSLRRCLSDLDFDFASSASSTEDESGTYQFQYYLPHHSSTCVAVYTNCEWVAYNQAPRSVEPYTSPDSVHLPDISEADFRYYPVSADLQYTSEESTDNELSNKETAKLKKRMSGTSTGWMERSERFCEGLGKSKSGLERERRA